MDSRIAHEDLPYFGLVYTNDLKFKALRAVRRARSQILRVNVRVPNEFTFRGTFGVTFVHFWDHCWSNFRLPGALLGRCGLIFSVKNGLGHQKCPKSRQSEISGISPHPFGDLLELCFRTFSYFFGKNSGSEICPFFRRFLGRPERSTGWAHMQSVHACAVQTHFSIFALLPKNSFQKRSRWVHFGSIFL